MIERTCYQKLDEPVLVWLGLEWREVALAIGGGVVTALGGMVLGLGFLGLLLGLGMGGGLILLFRGLRFGGPGYVFARAYRLGLLELLPPGIRPRHLLRLPGAGRMARFHLSPVLGDEIRRGARDARCWFGR